MATKTYRVEGMTCNHCVMAVSNEVGSVDGVASVAVDLESGVVTVTGEAFDDVAIAAAVDEAGYTLAS